MIQKCPNCGQWCETEGSGMLDRVGQGIVQSTDNIAGALGGDNPGILSSFIAGGIGLYTGLVRGAAKAIFNYKYEFHCPNCGHEWGTDSEQEDETDQLLEEYRKELDEFFSSVKSKTEEYINANRPKNAIKYLEKLINDTSDSDKIAYLYQRMAIIYINYIEDYEAALTACDRGLKALIDEEWSSNDTFLMYYKYVAESNLGQIWAARRDALIVYQHAEDETIITEDGAASLEEVANRAFDRFNHDFAEKYLNLDYKERKTLVTVPAISDASTVCVDVFSMNSLPDNISFPVGHPVVNQVYVGHPYLPEKYLPLETYQYAFVEDRVREFCELAQALGATEITVEALNASNTNHNESRDRRGTGGASYSGRSVSGSYHENRAFDSVEEKYQTLNFHQEYEPNEPIHLPEKMVWYPHEAGWQRLYQQRLKGILSHEERIETRKSQVLSGSELKEIKGEVETIFDANGEWDESMEEKYTQEDNAILSIKVKFAPLSKLKVDTSLFSNQLSITEQEYVEMFKEYIADGEIADRERKLLDKYRSRLGISEDRARELEGFYSRPQLTNDEQEYLEMYIEYAADEEISERDRKMLNKMRVRMGISEERARIIEATCR